MANSERTDDIPEWFELSKYSATQSFNAAEWHAQLNARRELLTDHPDIIYKLPKSHENYNFCIEYWRSTIPAMVNSLRETPIHKIENDWLSTIYFQPVRPLKIQASAVASYLELDMAKRHPTELNCLAAEKWKIIGNKDHRVTPEIADLDFKIFDQPILVVNLNATDAVLSASFSAWLKEARSTPTKSSSKREQPAYKDWTRYGLLPYLDLFIWSEETGNEITHQKMANAVGYFRGGDSFRKTVPKLAIKLMSNLAELECLAAIEASKSLPE